MCVHGRRLGPALGGAALLALAACSGPSVSCSAPETLSALREIATREYKRRPAFRYMFDFDRSRYEVSAIVTQASGPNSVTCSGELTIYFVLTKELQHIKDTDERAWRSMIGNNFRGADRESATVPIEYEVQLTDDRQNIYVTVSGL